MGKLLYFGYNKKDHLDNSIEGVIDYKSEYLDIVSSNENNYLIMYDKEVNYIDVVEIIQDIYLDGSYVVYGNSQESEECKKLENYFNRNDIKNYIIKGVAPLMFLDESYKRPNMSLVNDNKFTMIIIIKSKVFINTRNSLNENRNKSFSDLICKKKILK